jgi:predicted GH43/DUF377 family glycosyl hydrolase
MMFQWKKLGQIFCPNHNFEWMISHAANPFPVIISESLLRIYFTARDSNNRSCICFLDLDINDNFKIINLCNKPVVEPGSLGYFDDSGAAMGFYLEHEGYKYIYYLGWNLKVTVPWQNSIGLAIAKLGSDDFTKSSRAPILDRSNEDPFSISYPSVLIEDKVFKMWYGSNTTWGSDQNKMNHIIKYAESPDGIHWTRTNQICIDLSHPKEYAISKPYVIRAAGLYRMWYSYRANGIITTYRIGYAESSDGINWKRKDELAGIDVSSTGWDSEMICYPSIFCLKNKYFMLYNGNGYGKTGFGLAVNMD